MSVVPDKVVKRPAETTGLAGAAALIIGRAAGIDDPNTIVAIGVLAAALPAAITWLVTLLRK